MPERIDHNTIFEIYGWTDSILRLNFHTLLTRFLAGVVLWLCASVAAAGTSCDVAPLGGDKSFQLDLGPYACVYVDDSRTQDLPEILTAETSAAFQPVATGLVDFGFGTARYWVRVKIRNDTNAQETWWITHDIPMADLVRVRLVPSIGPARSLLELSGDAPFDARPIPHRHLVSSVALDAGETVEVVVDYVTGQGTQMPIFAEAVGSFVDRTQSEMAHHLLIIALLLGMGLISTVYFYSLEGPPALIYGAYVLSVAAMLAHMEGYGFQLIYPRAVFFNEYGFPILGFGSQSLGLLFVSRLTRTRKLAPHLFWLVVISVVLLFAQVVTAPALLSLAWYKIGSLIVAGIASVVQVAVIYHAMRRGQSGAWLLLAAFAVTSAAIVLVAVGYLTEGLFPQELAGSAIRFSYLLEAIAFSGAIALRVREARRARDQSLREQLRLTKESLRLSEAVQKAETDLQDAEQAAHRSREALSSAAHDIRQPLTSIQMLLAEAASNDPKISGNISYIEDILHKGLETEAEPLGTGARDPVSQGTKERFAASLVLDNIAAMFAEEARRKGINLRVMPSSAKIVADPLSLMRAVSNLVSNALSHSEASRITVGCRRRPNALVFEVHDTGKGMSQAELSRVAERGAKGESSSGSGLGLAIARTLSEQQGMLFSLHSQEGKGTVGRINVPSSSGWAEDQKEDQDHG